MFNRTTLLQFPAEAYTVGWICAIPAELAAAREMLDREHAPLKAQHSQDKNTYILGSMGEHKVSIAVLPSYGTTSAAIALNSMLHSFPKLRFGLMVGIGGGIPREDKDIRLGDIVVSLPDEQGGGVIQYDLGRLEVEGFKRVGVLNKPPTLLRTAVRTMTTEKHLGREIWNTVNEVFCEDDDDDDDDEINKWASPGPKNDALFEAEYIHKAGKSSCIDCEKGNAIERKERRMPYPKVHYGNIASGNSVMKDAKQRDLLAEKENVICFEMEAAGMMEDFPCLVIRGICDYADSHKNYQWQPYAAAVAAVYTKKLLSLIPPQAVSDLTPVTQSEQVEILPAIKKNVHWVVDRIVNPLFTGRDDILSELRQKLCKQDDDGEAKQQKRFVIYGMGGAGKSEVCLKFANDNRDSFWGIFWIDGSSEATIKEGFQAAYKRVKKEEVEYATAKEWIENEEMPWLVILDNCDDPETDYSKYFPTGNRGALLMTTRVPDCKEYATVGSRRFQKLGKAESISLLLRACHNSEDSVQYTEKDAEPVVAELDEHALTLTQAGAYIRKRLCKMDEYCALLASQRKSLLGYRPKQSQSQYGDVYATFEVSARAMGNSGECECADALELLGFLAHLDRNGVSEEIFTRAWKYPHQIVEPAEDEIEFLSTWHMARRPKLLRAQDTTKELDLRGWRAAREVLHSFSLVTLTQDANGVCRISMHPLTHAWARDRLEAGAAAQAWAASATVLALSVHSSGWEDFFTIIYAHIDFCLGHDPDQFFHEFPPLELCRVFYRFGCVLYRLGYYNRASQIAALVCTRIDYEIQPHTWPWRSVQYLRAICLRAEGEDKKAIPLHEQIVRYDAAHLAAHDYSRLAAQRGLAINYRETGQTQKSFKLLKKLVRAHQSLGEVHRDLRLLSQHELAVTYTQLQKYQQALKLQKQRLQNFQDFQMMKDPELLTTRLQLAYIYSSLKQSQKALKLLKSGYKVERKIFHATHPSLLTIMNHLAAAYTDTKRPQKALKLLKKTVKLRARTMGATHPELLTSQHNLAQGYLEMGQPWKARKLLEIVVRNEAVVLDVKDRRRLNSQHKLGKAYLATGQSEKAVRLLKKVVAIREEVLDSTDYSRFVSQHELARAYLATGQPENAVQLLKKVVAITEEVLETTDRGRLVSQEVLAAAYWDAEQHEKAVKLMEEVVRIQSTMLHPDQELFEASKEFLSRWKGILDNESTEGGKNGVRQGGDSEERRDGVIQIIEPVAPTSLIPDASAHGTHDGIGGVEQISQAQEPESDEFETVSISSYGSSVLISDESSAVISEIGSPWVMSDESSDEETEEVDGRVGQGSLEENRKTQEVEEFDSKTEEVSTKQDHGVKMLDEEDNVAPRLESLTLDEPLAWTSSTTVNNISQLGSAKYDSDSDTGSNYKSPKRKKRDTFKSFFKAKK
ncbi:Kinesin light chain 5 [Phlyctema vagabunda]|uniref:Kinesin light chain 5 n=1 Tax=Phlyctema vagabunda TaxID=108571 RepID=A0ABR4PCR3_9HELO